MNIKYVLVIMAMLLMGINTYSNVLSTDEYNMHYMQRMKERQTTHNHWMDNILTIDSYYLSRSEGSPDDYEERKCRVRGSDIKIRNTGSSTSSITYVPMLHVDIIISNTSIVYFTGQSPKAQKSWLNYRSKYTSRRSAENWLAKFNIGEVYPCWARGTIRIAMEKPNSSDAISELITLLVIILLLICCCCCPCITVLLILCCLVVVFVPLFIISVVVTLLVSVITIFTIFCIITSFLVIVELTSPIWLPLFIVVILGVLVIGSIGVAIWYYCTEDYTIDKETYEDIDKYNSDRNVGYNSDGVEYN